MKATQTSTIIALLLIFILTFNTSAQAQVEVVRGGQENPLVTIGKSTLYGAGTGILLGLAYTLISDADTWDIMKWSFVSGTFGGFAIGLIHVTSRPEPSSAILQFNGTSLAKVDFPRPRVRFNRNQTIDFKIQLASVSL